MAAYFIRITLSISLLVLCSCARQGGQAIVFHEFEQEVANLATSIDEHESTAVSWVYDQTTGDITLLGNSWRDRFVTALRKAGIVVKSRKDITLLIDDIETFSPDLSEQAVWASSGADIVVVGEYLIDSEQKKIRVNFKALRKDATVVGTVTWSENLPRNWFELAARVKGNVFQQEIAEINGTGRNLPVLQATLNRDPVCYPPGSEAEIQVKSEPGVHLYIFNLAADNTVSLLFPNSRLHDQKLTTGKLTFPPPALKDEMKLLLYPLQQGKTSQESFKVVASRTAMDFSFLPVPENSIYTGARGGDIRKMLQVLEDQDEWSEKMLHYWVGPECEK